MIVLSTSDPVVRLAVLRVARPDEEVVFDLDGVQGALEDGYPRIYVLCDDGEPAGFRRGRPEVPVLELRPEALRAWEAERRRAEVPPPRVDHLAERLGRAIAETALEATWVDRLLADLARSAGTALPLPFRAFARRTLEYPRRYTDLGALASAAELSRGALKARFRRRELESPYTYLRWLRALAVAHELSSHDATVAMVARRLGFTSDGNMCRMVRRLTGATPGSLRGAGEQRRLVAAFAHRYLTPGAVLGWRELEDLFGRSDAA